MKREDARVGQGVVYRPHPAAPAEDGEITELRDGGAMVRYSAMGSAKLTRYDDLQPAARSHVMTTSIPQRAATTPRPLPPSRRSFHAAPAGSPRPLPRAVRRRRPGGGRLGADADGRLAVVAAAEVPLQQPTVPGKVDGIIGVDPMVLQCRDCGLTAEQPEGQGVALFIILSGFHFCAHEAEPKRRCPDCLAVVRAACSVCSGRFS